MKTLLAMAALPLAVALSPTAHADAYDFIRMLDLNKVRYVSADDAIRTGTMACSRMRRGEPVETLNSYMLGYDYRDSNMIAVAASQTLCSDQWSKVQAAISHGLKVR